MAIPTPLLDDRVEHGKEINFIQGPFVKKVVQAFFKSPDFFFLLLFLGCFVYGIEKNNWAAVQTGGLSFGGFIGNVLWHFIPILIGVTLFLSFFLSIPKGYKRLLSKGKSLYLKEKGLYWKRRDGSNHQHQQWQQAPIGVLIQEEYDSFLLFLVLEEGEQLVVLDTTFKVAIDYLAEKLTNYYELDLEEKLLTLEERIEEGQQRDAAVDPHIEEIERQGYEQEFDAFDVDY